MKILCKETLADTRDTKIIKLNVSAPEVARKAKAGQFAAVMVSEHGERIPLTIVGTEPDKGIITLIVQEAGLSTKLLGRLEAGSGLYALSGPLGHPAEIRKYGKVILAGGGVGIAEIYPLAEALKKADNHITVILGARTKELLILMEELKSLSDDFHVITDDGSYGKKGFTTDVLKELLESSVYNLAYVVGPVGMMKKACEVTKEFNLNTKVSLNALMVDAAGMCGVCRVTVGGEVKFSCVDGPEFDGQKVQWDELEKRNRVYVDKEKHICGFYKL